MTRTFRSLFRGLATGALVVFACGAQLAGAGPITALDAVELIPNGGRFQYDYGWKNVDNLDSKSAFHTLSSGLLGERIEELKQLGSKPFHPVVTEGLTIDRGKVDTEVVSVPEPTSLLLLATGLGALMFGRRRTQRA